MTFARKTIVSALLITSFFTGFSQSKLTLDAEKAYLTQKYDLAIDLYKKAYSKEKKKEVKADIIYKLGDCYYNTLDYKQAITWFAKAKKANHPGEDITFKVAESLRSQGNYEEAIIKYNEYKAENPKDPRADMGIESCEQAKRWQDEPVKYEIIPIPTINSKQYDFSPIFGDKKGQSLIFTSTREGSTGKDMDERIGQSFSDLYITKVDKNGKWSTPVILTGEVNTEGNEGSSTFNRKYNAMYYTRCSNVKSQVSGCQIYYAKKSGNSWTKAEKIDLGIADTLVAGHPAINTDETILVFASDLPGGLGGKDLFYSLYDRKGKKWGAPVNLGPEINTNGDEMFPYIDAKGNLFFSSNGRMGMGGLDIFKAEKAGDNKWAKPQNMKAPINSQGNDFGIIINDAEDRGFFTSDRPGSKGADDIYMFTIPKVIFILQGNVADVETGTPIPDAVVKLQGSDGSSAEMKTDANGFFRFAENGSNRYVNENVNYNILVTAKDYLNGKGKETTQGLKESTTFIKDFSLQGIKKPIRMPSVEFELAKANLTQAGKDSVDFLYTVLTENPQIRIELNAHTDTRGNDKANLKLSDDRAKSCVDYLISRGIEEGRMVSKGLGETTPLISDAVINKMASKEEKEAAHQKNRRVTFNVTGTDWVSQTIKEEAPEAVPGSETQEQPKTEEGESNQDEAPADDAPEAEEEAPLQDGSPD